MPVQAGLWQHKELWDGTYTITDLIDILPVARQKMLKDCNSVLNGLLGKNV
jgi:hypothetical protein